MSSLFKRVTFPLLAVAAATALCAPSRAATASFAPCQALYPGTSYQGIGERVECSIYTTSNWAQVDYHAVLLGGGDPHMDTKYPYTWGSGDYYFPTEEKNRIYLGPTSSGTYNCWAICLVSNSGGNSYVSTGGTYYVTF